MTNNEAAKWIQLYIDLAKLDPTTGEAAYLNDDDKKTIEAMEMAINVLTAQPETHSCDLIDRRALMKEFSDFVRASNNSDFAPKPTWNDAVSLVKSMPPAQPSSSCAHENDQDLQPTCNNLVTDCISRQAAIDAMTTTLWHYPNECYRNLNEYEFAKGLAELGLKSVPSAQHELAQNLHNACADLISRQAAIDALDGEIEITGRTNAEAVKVYVRLIKDRLERLPSAQPDLSSYSDKLWRNAYERGKAEAQAEIVRCKDCKWKQGAECVRFADVRPWPDDFCSRAERREE